MRLNVLKTFLKFLSTIQSLFTWIFDHSYQIYFYTKQNFERQKMKYVIFHNKASTVNMESLLENIKSMALQHKSLSIKHTSMSFQHISMILNIRNTWISQTSMTFQHSSMTLQQSSITLQQSSMLISHSSMDLPHSPKYGYFKSMRPCFALIPRKTGAILSLRFFRRYKVA